LLKVSIPITKALHENVGLFYAQNIGRKTMLIIQNHQIDRHKADVGE
jgi:hypothetical protein